MGRTSVGCACAGARTRRVQSGCIILPQPHKLVQRSQIPACALGVSLQQLRDSRMMCLVTSSEHLCSSGTESSPGTMCEP